MFLERYSFDKQYRKIYLEANEIKLINCGQLIYRWMLFTMLHCCGIRERRFIVLFTVYGIGILHIYTHILLSHYENLKIIVIIPRNKLFTILTAPSFLKISCCWFPRWCTIISVQWVISNSWMKRNSCVFTLLELRYFLWLFFQRHLCLLGENRCPWRSNDKRRMWLDMKSNFHV